MIAGFKCSFCSHFDTDKENVLEHEIDCSFNHRNKTCYTCDHHYYEGYGSDQWDECEIGIEIFRVTDGDCKGWENKEYLKEQRTKKLSKLV